jgi:hypothetical protein
MLHWLFYLNLLDVLFYGRKLVESKVFVVDHNRFTLFVLVGLYLGLKQLKRFSLEQIFFGLIYWTFASGFLCFLFFRLRKFYRLVSGPVLKLLKELMSLFLG